MFSSLTDCAVTLSGVPAALRGNAGQHCAAGATMLRLLQGRLSQDKQHLEARGCPASAHSPRTDVGASGGRRCNTVSSGVGVLRVYGDLQCGPGGGISAPRHTYSMGKRSKWIGSGAAVFMWRTVYSPGRQGTLDGLVETSNVTSSLGLLASMVSEPVAT